MRCYVDMLLITSTANIKTWERDNGLYGGLSPLARGTLGIGAIAALCVRFIPADVGNSKTNFFVPMARPVYPRWRGELPLYLCTQSFTDGLSPLARGTRRTTDPCRTRRRFIPAGAGNSFPHSSRAHLRTVYPRWRGELNKPLIPKFRKRGLSPLARGTRLLTLT